MEKVVLIPAYKPDERFVAFVHELAQHEFDIVVIDDGSGAEFDGIFEAARDCCTLIRYSPNKGKGYALKTGFAHISEKMPDCKYIITADADGQHTVPDIKKVAEKMEKEKRGIVLGARYFENEVPFRSRFGNAVTRLVYRLAAGVKLHDTQTGLRAFCAGDCEWLCSIRGNRYEYEMNVLMEAAESKIPLHETKIATVYENNNASSHFRTFRDSVRIYGIIYLASPRLKYISSSMICFLIYYFLTLAFSSMGWMTDLSAKLAALLPESIAAWHPIQNLISNSIAMIFAWLISSFSNFSINRSFVFKKKDAYFASLVGYYSLAAVSFLFKSLATEVFAALFDNRLAIIMPIVETVFFIINYILQHKLIFGKTKKKKHKGEVEAEKTDG